MKLAQSNETPASHLTAPEVLKISRSVQQSVTGSALINAALPQGAIEIEPPVALLFKGKIRIVQAVTAASLRNWRRLKLEERGKERLVLEIKDGLLIDTLVASGRLTERDVSDEPVKVQTELKKLKGEIEENVADFLRLLRLKKNTRDGTLKISA
jgi:hypothetical protein